MSASCKNKLSLIEATQGSTTCNIRDNAQINNYIGDIYKITNLQISNQCHNHPTNLNAAVDASTAGITEAVANLAITPVVRDNAVFPRKGNDVIKPVPSDTRVDHTKIEADLRGNYHRVMTKLAGDLMALPWKYPDIERYNTLDAGIEPLYQDGSLVPPSQVNTNDGRVNFHRQYVQLMNPDRVKVLFLGLYPGSDGMGRNGIPFGDPQSVKRVLGIQVPVRKHKNGNPVEEPSGRRLWGLLEDKFRDIGGSLSTREEIFKNCFVQNICPILFRKNGRKTVSPFDPKDVPDKAVREGIERLCDKALIDVIELLQPRVIVAIGRVVERRAKSAIKRYKKTELTENEVVYMTHPSPSTRRYNDDGWKEVAFKELSHGRVLEIMQ